MEALVEASIHLLAGLRHIRAAIDAWSPLAEAESESDRAGRLGELQVKELFDGVSGVVVFQSLRVPDAESRGRREIDLVVLTRTKMFLIEVKNWSGAIRLQSDGSWCQVRRNGSRQVLPNVVEETKYRVELLEAYIARRGVTLPPGFIEYRVFLVNPDCRPEADILYQREVLTPNRWQTFLGNDLETARSSWLDNLLPSVIKNRKPDPAQEQLHFILGTIPTWDKLQLEGGKIVVGDFLHFIGSAEDMEALRSVKRSHVSHLEVSHSRSLLWNVLGLLVGAWPQVKLVCSSRDVRKAGGFLRKRHLSRENVPVEIRVRPNVEVVFRVVGSSQKESFQLNNVRSLTLSV